MGIQTSIGGMLRTKMPTALIAVWFVLSTVLIFFVAPTEATMGDVQRILYLHVSVAWGGLASGIALGFCAAMYLSNRRLVWDHWAQAATEVGLICATLTLVSGSAWAREAWGTWWTWDPRLTSSMILWMIYAGILVARASIDDPHRRARLGGVLAIVGMCDVPLVIMATRWFRGVHPVAPEMDGSMRLVLFICIACFMMLFGYLIYLRRRQLEITEEVMQLEADAWYSESNAWHAGRRGDAHGDGGPAMLSSPAAT